MCRLETTLTAEEARHRLAYDAETGCLTWVNPASHRVRKGDIVTSVRADGYIQVGIAGRRYMAHRVIWLMVTGSWPTNLVDHKDGDKTNNRWVNLRCATHVLNAQNLRRGHKDSKHGLLGVSFIRGRKKNPFRSELRVDGRSVYLGTFPTPETAHSAYLAAKRQHHRGNTL